MCTCSIFSSSQSGAQSAAEDAEDNGSLKKLVITIENRNHKITSKLTTSTRKSKNCKISNLASSRKLKNKKLEVQNEN